ncbi:MAG: tryptophan--tRNA ligase [Verrucomicrobia bacterium]|nr:MAG: tryptophan--tRNA ligase [Verrucomicrobiota bacterium]TAE87249.1 MAG: tryptophan--tRNA ligase [Verrucomicrobiota bacterium]TAF25119.1 MAG: tryptophan--tRNA ligase [Verrucomicrobiota bacterium]
MRILTGLQPSGKLHVGNYFGAMEPAVRLQEEGEAFYFIANYHAMTTVKNPLELRAFTRELAVDFLACGLDPERAVFFLQSAVPEVNELAWILSTVCPVSQLEKAHSYKDKIAHGFSPSHGLFAYPVLMAADILLYDSRLVPVGKDQKQHLEITRDLAGKINEAFGEGTLVVPEPMIRDATAVVPGLDGQKMSKSYGNTLPLFATPDEARKLIMKKLVTDATPLEAPKPQENSTLLSLYRLMAGEVEVAAMEADYERGGVGYGDFKKRLLEAYLGYFEPMRLRRDELLADPGYVDAVLARGAEKARAAAAPVLDRVRRAVGLA